MKPDFSDSRILKVYLTTNKQCVILHTASMQDKDNFDKGRLEGGDRRGPEMCIVNPQNLQEMGCRSPQGYQDAQMLKSLL